MSATLVARCRVAETFNASPTLPSLLHCSPSSLISDATPMPNINLPNKGDKPASQQVLAQQPASAPDVGYNPDYAALPAEWPTVKLRLEVKDMSHEGAALFFRHVNPVEALSSAVLNVFKWLYTKRTCPRQ